MATLSTIVGDGDCEDCDDDDGAAVTVADVDNAKMGDDSNRFAVVADDQHSEPLLRLIVVGRKHSAYVQPPIHCTVHVLVADREMHL